MKYILRYIIINKEAIKLNPHDINPFVRFAMVAKISVYPLKCYDNRLIYVKNGSTDLIINDKTYNLKKGSVALIRPDTEYYVKNPHSAEIILITFDYTSKNTTILDPIMPAEV